MIPSEVQSAAAIGFSEETRRTPDPRSDMPVRDDEAGALARVGEEMGRHTDMIDGVSVGHNKGANHRHAHR